MVKLDNLWSPRPLVFLLFTHFRLFVSTENIAPQSCADLSALGIRTSGLHYVGYPEPFPVSCDMDTDGGGWTVIQRRQDGSVPFDRLWTEYEQGFGNISGELWIGLDKLHSLTTQTNELYIYLEDWEGNSRYARYSTFSVGYFGSDYTATLSGYSGDAGDGLTQTDNGGRHNINGIRFSTQDQDNDDNNNHCAADFGQGGWWYPLSCGWALLNGRYLTGCSITNPPSCPIAQGIFWKSWKTSEYSLKGTTMMIRPRSFPVSDMCQNGGTVTPGPPRTALYTCVCTPEWTGTYCDTEKGATSLHFFDVYNGQILDGHDSERITEITPAECATKCLEGTAAVPTGACLSFDYDHDGDGVCILSTANKDTHGATLNSGGARFDYYHRRELIPLQSCDDLSAMGIKNSGSYFVGYPEPFPVSCDMDTDGGGWTVIQRRQDGSVPFNNNWDLYVQGFGNISGEFWLGLEKLHNITTQTQHELYIYLEDWEGNSRYARYSTFSVGDLDSKYTATLSGYSGNAGDDLTLAQDNGRHNINGREFSTQDQDNDDRTDVHCAATFGQGGWWYPLSCGFTLLTGRYLTGCSTTNPPSCPSSEGIVWKSWKTNKYSLKKTTMMIRPEMFPMPDKCQNGGTVTSGPEGTGLYTCVCRLEWTGTYCDIEKEIIVPQSCEDLSALGILTSGVHYVGYPEPFPVFCDMDTDGGGWTVIQRRQDGSVPFNNNWDLYVQGFGDISGEFWIGLEKLHNITTQTQNELLIYLEDWEGNSTCARYSNFSVGDRDSNYTATLSGYSGDAGDGLTQTDNGGRHNINGIRFSTQDQDNDDSNNHCAADFGRGGWWYPLSCGWALLNGRYLTGCSTTNPPSCPIAQGIFWKSWKTSEYSLKGTTMMIRPGSFPDPPNSLRTCENGGVPAEVAPGTGVYVCTCSAGWEGTYCEQDINECLPQPCANGGSCAEGAPGSGTYSCRCAVGWTGDNCNTDVDECSPNPCGNGGTCTQGPEGSEAYSCVCTDEWTGQNCNQDIDECSPNPCGNGGTCTQGPEGSEAYSCVCKDEWTGQNCDQVPTSSLGVIIGGTVGAVVALIAVGAGGLFIYRRRKKGVKQAGKRDLALTNIEDCKEERNGGTLNEAFATDDGMQKDCRRLSQLRTVQDVKNFLEAHGLKELSTAFEENDVDGRALRGMNDAILKDLIPKAGPRARLTALLTELKTPAKTPTIPVQPDLTTSNLNYWEIPRANLKLGKRLGGGQFGEVWLGEVRKRGVTTTVAVKTLKSSASDSDKRDLLGELEILTTVGRHDNIISLVGACTKDGPLRLVVEYAPNGCLKDWLVTNSAVLNADSEYKNQPVSLSTLPIEQLLKFGIDVSNGMSHLAAMECVHRDLAARNVLLGETLVAKISDFGLSRDIYESSEYTRSTKTKLPLRWMAYESLFYNVYTSQSDVWSFGVLLWEIMTMGKQPYKGMSGKRMMDMIKDGGRLEKPSPCPDEIYDIMTTCWTISPEDRPSFPQLSASLSRTLQDFKPYTSLLK